MVDIRELKKRVIFDEQAAISAARRPAAEGQERLRRSQHGPQAHNRLGQNEHLQKAHSMAKYDTLSAF
jgi:hypothetical protein